MRFRSDGLTLEASPKRFWRVNLETCHETSDGMGKARLDGSRRSHVLLLRGDDLVEHYFWRCSQSEARSHEGVPRLRPHGSRVGIELRVIEMIPAYMFQPELLRCQPHCRYQSRDDRNPGEPGREGKEKGEGGGEEGGREGEGGRDERHGERRHSRQNEVDHLVRLRRRNLRKPRHPRVNQLRLSYPLLELSARIGRWVRDAKTRRIQDLVVLECHRDLPARSA